MRSQSEPTLNVGRGRVVVMDGETRRDCIQSRRGVWTHTTSRATQNLSLEESSQIWIARRCTALWEASLYFLDLRPYVSI